LTPLMRVQADVDLYVILSIEYAVVSSGSFSVAVVQHRAGESLGECPSRAYHVHLS
jgi:hypothetical protein